MERGSGKSQQKKESEIDFYRKRMGDADFEGKNAENRKKGKKWNAILMIMRKAKERYSLVISICF